MSVTSFILGMLIMWAILGALCLIGEMRDLGISLWDGYILPIVIIGPLWIIGFPYYVVRKLIKKWKYEIK